MGVATVLGSGGRTGGGVLWRTTTTCAVALPVASEAVAVRRFEPTETGTPVTWKVFPVTVAGN
jgi:hypothetical protein